MLEYKNEKLVVRYDPDVCIHAGDCVRGLTSVFDVSKKPWIDVNGASPEEVVEQVKRCPSGRSHMNCARTPNRARQEGPPPL